MIGTPSMHQWSNPLEGLLGYQIRRASVVMMADLQGELEPLNLRPAEASALILIDANPRCSQSELGRALGVKRANMVPLISRLETLGYVQRSALDGRSQALSISTAGQPVVSEIRQRMKAHEARCAAAIDPGLAKAVIDAMQRVRARCESDK